MIPRLRLALLLLLLAPLAFLPSCRAQSDMEEVTLTTSALTLTFGAEGSEQHLAVHSSSGSWTYLAASGTDWLTLTQQGDELLVRAEANAQNRERRASIILLSGDKQQRLEVIQSPAAAQLTAYTELIEFPAEGGQQQLRYRSNGGVPEVELAEPVDWLTITPLPESGLELTAQPTTERRGRSAKLLIHLGQVIREVRVQQRGTINYQLPLLQFPASLDAVLRYEQGRGAILFKSPDGGYNRTGYRFRTMNKLLPAVQYEFEDEDAPSFTSASMSSYDAQPFLANPDFAAYLQEQGFTKVGTAAEIAGNEISYRHGSLPYELTIRYSHSGGALFNLSYIAEQDKPYPTFAQVPLQRQLKLLGSIQLQHLGADRKAVRALEQGLGSTLESNFGMDNYDRYTVKQSYEGELSRGYFYSYPYPLVISNCPYETWTLHL